MFPDRIHVFVGPQKMSVLGHLMCMKTNNNFPVQYFQGNSQCISVIFYLDLLAESLGYYCYTALSSFCWYLWIVIIL